MTNDTPPPERDVLHVAEPARQYDFLGYGPFWEYAGRTYRYDPTEPGARERFERDEALSVLCAIICPLVVALGAVLLGGADGQDALTVALIFSVLSGVPLLLIAGPRKVARRALRSFRLN